MRNLSWCIKNPESDHIHSLEAVRAEPTKGVNQAGNQTALQWEERPHKTQIHLAIVVYVLLTTVIMF